MAFSKLDIKNEIILSLPAGGQIQTALLDQRIDFCMKKIFAETEILKLTRYINEVKDQQFYRIGESQTSETNHPGDIETINVCRLSRVKHKDGTTNYDISTVDERTVIPKSQYSFVSAVEDSSREMKLYLHNKSSETKTAGIELLFSASTASTTYVDPLFIQDFRDALLADIKYYYLMDTGRPWFNPNVGSIELKKFYEALNRLRFKSNTGFTNGTMTVSPSYGFII
jgi:hypothetical protein|tara:strand:+ start:2987 stop:3667 length:681 start_codon:yes stop_codon:yes gene_type:complete